MIRFIRCVGLLDDGCEQVRHLPALVLPIKEVPYTVNGKKVSSFLHAPTFIWTSTKEISSDHYFPLKLIRIGTITI